MFMGKSSVASASLAGIPVLYMYRKVPSHLL